MCVIMHKPAKTDIPSETFTKCWEANPHGAGFMYATDGGFLRVVNGLMSLNDFTHAYVNHECVKKEVVIHFRLASAGAITPEQTHPFWVFKDLLAFVHNGHMSGYAEGGLDQSDTMSFNKELLSQLPKDFLKNGAIVELLDSYIDGSIMVFMDNLGEVSVLGNASFGMTKGGVWYSNGYWCGEDCVSESVLDEKEKVEIHMQELRDIRDRLEAAGIHEEYLRALNGEYAQPDMFPNT